MKKIAITQRLYEEKSYNETREMLDVQWGSLFRELDFVPIVMPMEFDSEIIYNSVGFEGIVLTGGNDLSIINNDSLSVKRDLFEKKLIEFGIGKKIPILGVCRGMQVVADYFDSTFKKVEGHIKTFHKLNVSEKSKYKNLLKELGAVNSFHSYSVDTVSNSLAVSATSEDGSTEAIEHVELKIFGQMWHPERKNPFSDSEKELFTHFFSNRS